MGCHCGHHQKRGVALCLPTNAGPESILEWARGVGPTVVHDSFVLFSSKSSSNGNYLGRLMPGARA